MISQDLLHQRFQTAQGSRASLYYSMPQPRLYPQILQQSVHIP